MGVGPGLFFLILRKYCIAKYLPSLSRVSHQICLSGSKMSLLMQTDDDRSRLLQTRHSNRKVSACVLPGPSCQALLNLKYALGDPTIICIFVERTLYTRYSLSSHKHKSWKPVNTIFHTYTALYTRHISSFCQPT